MRPHSPGRLGSPLRQSPGCCGVQRHGVQAHCCLCCCRGSLTSKAHPPETWISTRGANRGAHWRSSCTADNWQQPGASCPSQALRHVALWPARLREEGSILMVHVAGVLNLSDDSARPSACCPRARRCRRAAGHSSQFALLSTPLAVGQGGCQQTKVLHCAALQGKE